MAPPSAQIIPFPEARIHRHPDLVDALDKLAMLDEYDASGDPMKVAVGEAMRDWWERELVRLGGVPRALLVRDTGGR